MAKFTEAQIKQHIKKVEEAAKKHERERDSKEDQFKSLTPEEIRKKLARVNSPFFNVVSWQNATTPGGTESCGFGFYNPDPGTASSLFVHAWIGSGNVDPTVGTFLLNVDPRFPRLTQPTSIFGVTLQPSTSASVSFSLKVPATAEKTTYICNACLVQINPFDVGVYFDRACFAFNVA